MTYAWDAPELAVAGDTAFVRQRRLLQSWYREHVLRVGPGRAKGRATPVSNRIDPFELVTQPGLNFLHPAAYFHARERAVEVPEEGGTLDEDRLIGNMLSSMPMCFNVFGALGLHPNFLSLFQQVFDERATKIEKVICEWAPRPRERFLGDRTAFDAAVWYLDDEGRRCLLGVEAKYTDSFSVDIHRTQEQRYRQVTESSGWFEANAFELLFESKTSSQLWRNMLLAASIEAEKSDGEQPVHRAGVAVLCCADDPGYEKVEAEMRPLLTEAGDDHLRHVSLERLGEVARADEHLGTWARRFERRYLADPEQLPSDQEIADGACPACDGRGIEILYGMPHSSIEEEVEAGRVVLGGCAIDPGSPRWSCSTCGHQWGERRETYEPGGQA